MVDNYRAAASTGEPQPFEGVIVDFDAVVAALADQGIPGRVEQSGGNTATIYLGDGTREANEDGYGRWVLLIGPGWFEGSWWTQGRGAVGDLVLGPDDQGECPIEEPSSQDEVITMAAAAYRRILAGPTSPDQCPRCATVHN